MRDCRKPLIATGALRSSTETLHLGLKTHWIAGEETFTIFNGCAAAAGARRSKETRRSFFIDFLGHGVVREGGKTFQCVIEGEANVSVPRIKVCCIASVAEARRAIDAGASALGLVSTMPSGPGVIAWETIAAIAAAVPPPIATFLLTCSQDAEEIVEQQRRCGTSVVQICDRLLRGSYAELRRALPGIRLVQVIHVVDTSSIDEARAAARHVDALLLDSGNQSLAVKELGGTGRVHDWTLSARIRADNKRYGDTVKFAG